MGEKEVDSEVIPFEELEVGDYVVGPDGEFVEVATVYDEHIPETMYEITLENGETIEASGNHLWYIETENDIATFHSRLKTSRKYLQKKMTDEKYDKLLDVATNYEAVIVETSLIDMISLISDPEDREAFKILLRVADSLGHISENEEVMEDFETGEYLDQTNIPHYDARLFSQQILALYKRRFARRWPIVKGQVVTTEELVNLYDSADIPTIKEM